MSAVRTEAHNITSKEAEGLFAEAGVSRSQRSLERYCEAGKLDCIADPDEGHYYITERSIVILTNHLKEIQERHQSRRVPAPPEPPASDKDSDVADSGGPGPAESPKGSEAGDAAKIDGRRIP